MEWASSLKSQVSRLATRARSSIDETTTDFQTKGVGAVLRETFEDTAESMKDLSSNAAAAARKAARDMQQGMDSAVNWMSGEETMPELGATPASSSQPRKGPVWKPPPIQRPPRLEELQKGTKVYRRGALAEVVKVDYEADPPSLVVRMMDTGNEVGTDAAHVSLRPEDSQRCLAAGVGVLIVHLQGRKELNGCKGVIIEYKADVGRWNVRLSSSCSTGTSASNSEAISVKPQNLSVLLAPSPEAPVSSPPRRVVASASQPAPYLGSVAPEHTSNLTSPQRAPFRGDSGPLEVDGPVQGERSSTLSERPASMKFSQAGQTSSVGDANLLPEPPADPEPVPPDVAVAAAGPAQALEAVSTSVASEAIAAPPNQFGKVEVACRTDDACPPPQPQAEPGKSTVEPTVSADRVSEPLVNEASHKASPSGCSEPLPDATVPPESGDRSSKSEVAAPPADGLVP